MKRLENPNQFSILKVGFLENEEEEPILPVSITFLDAETFEIFFFPKRTEEEDVVWDFLQFLKKRYLEQGKQTQRKVRKIYSHRGAQEDHKFLLDSLCAHEEVNNLYFPKGQLDLGWIIKTGKNTGIKIEFRTSMLTLSYSTLDKALTRYAEPFPLEALLKLFTIHKGGEDFSISADSEIVGCLELYFLSKFHHVLVSGPLESLEKSELGSPTGTAIKILNQVSGISERTLGSYNNREFYPFIRQATYGGRNELFRKYGENLNHYDFISFYTSCYDVSVPLGKMSWGNPNLDKATLCEATVKVPKDWYLGPLPYRYPDKGITYPVGEFTDWWDARLLRDVVKMGVDLTIRKQLNCEELPLLKEYGQWILDRALKDPKRKPWWNDLGIILHGKTLQHLEWEEIKTFDWIYAHYPDHDGWIPIHRDEVFWTRPISEEQITRTPSWHHPEIGMRIEAEGQRRLLEMLLVAKKKGPLYYCDTDSVFTPVDLPHVIDYQPGKLALKGKIIRAYFIRPKVYGLVFSKDGREVFDCTTSGLTEEDSERLTEGDFKAFLRDRKEISYARKVITSRDQVFSGEPIRITRQRSRFPGQSIGSRIHEGDDSRPIILP